MRRRHTWWSALPGIALLAVPFAVSAAPPAAGTTAPAGQQADLAARIGAARARNRQLQAEVARMERGNSAQQDQLRQRDAEIAALQEKLQAAGAPASAGSAGH